MDTMKPPILLINTLKNQEITAPKAPDMAVAMMRSQRYVWTIMPYLVSNIASYDTISNDKEWGSGRMHGEMGKL